MSRHAYQSPIRVCAGAVVLGGIVVLGVLALVALAGCRAVSYSDPAASAAIATGIAPARSMTTSVPAPSETTAAVLGTPQQLDEQPSAPPLPSRKTIAISAAPAPGTNRTTSVTLSWNPSPDHASVTNYNIYFGVAPGVYTNTARVGRATSCTISNLALRTRYYFRATADSFQGIESAPTPEIFWPQPFTNYVIVGIKSNGVPIVSLTYTNPPGDVVLFAPYIVQTNDAVTVLKLNTSGLLIGNTNQP